MSRKNELETQHNYKLPLPNEFYSYILDLEKNIINLKIVEAIQQNPSLIQDRGYLFSKELKLNGIDIAVSAIRYDEDIHILLSGDTVSYHVISSNQVFELDTQNYLQEFGHIKRTPLVSTLFFIQQSLESGNEIENWANSPAIILGHFERVGSTWLMDLVNQFGRSQVEPIRQHVSLNSPVNSFTELADNQQFDSYSFHSSLIESPYSQIWFRNYLASQFQGELQVSKETNLFFMLPFFLDLFPNNTPIIILKRDIRGILSSFKKGNLFANWEYQDRYDKLKNLVQSNSNLEQFQFLFDTTDEENWIDILITLYIINLHQIITTTLTNNKRTNIVTISYEEMVKDRDTELGKVTQLLNLELPEGISRYRSKSDSKSEFNTNKKKSNPHDWIEVLSMEEISFVEERIRERFMDIQTIFGHELATEFEKQGFIVEKNTQEKTETKKQKPVKDVILSKSQLSKEEIKQNLSFTEIPEHQVNSEIIPAFSISSSLTTNEEFITFLNEMQKEGVFNDLHGNYLFYNPNILANRGGRIFFSNGEYKVVDGYQRHPVCWVNWIGATAYSQWVGCTLPTLEQWKSITAQIPLDQKRNSDNMIGDTSAINQYPKNAHGIYDLYGNLKIWTNSWDESAGINENTGLALSTAGYAWNSRSERGNITYKPFLLSSSTLGIRLVKSTQSVGTSNFVYKLQQLQALKGNKQFLDNDIFHINEEIRKFLLEK